MVGSEGEGGRGGGGGGVEQARGRLSLEVVTCSKNKKNLMGRCIETGSEAEQKMNLFVYIY